MQFQGPKFQKFSGGESPEHLTDANLQIKQVGIATPLHQKTFRVACLLIC